VSPAAAAKFQMLVPKASTVALAGVHHMLTGDDNDAFLDAILPFLNDAFGMARTNTDPPVA
jgi:hypothetical protein